MHDHQKCRELFAKLSEYIDDELDTVTCETIEKHIQQCPPCQACLSTLKRTVALCRQMESTSAPTDLTQRIKAMIEKQSA